MRPHLRSLTSAETGLEPNVLRDGDRLAFEIETSDSTLRYASRKQDILDAPKTMKDHVELPFLSGPEITDHRNDYPAAGLKDIIIIIIRSYYPRG